MAWRASHGFMVWPGGPGMGYGKALGASRGIVWPGGHRMVYSMAWRASHGVCLWPGRRHWTWHSIWYGLAGMTFYIVWPGGHGMVYCMVWWARHDIWYDLAAMAWYTLWPGEHHMVYGMAWRTSHGYMVWPGEVYVMSKGILHVLRHCPFTRGVADVSWRSCSHVPDPFTSRGTFTSMFRSHVQLLFTLGRDSK